MSSPSFVEPLKNSTLATVPSASAAVAATETVAGGVNVAPLAGWVRLTVGAALGLTVTILATEGTPEASIANSMYTPGGAMSALRGAVAWSAPLPAVNDRGT